VGSHDEILEHVVVLLKATNFVLIANSCIKLGKFALMNMMVKFSFMEGQDVFNTLWS
jgi:hypothetical protein